MFSIKGSRRLMIHFPILQIQHGGTAGPPLWLFCTPTFLSLPRQLPPRLLASTQAGYVRPVYTTSSSFLFILLPPFQPDTFVSDKAISVLFWGLWWRTPPRPAGNHRDMFLGATTRLPDRRLRWKKKCTLAWVLRILHRNRARQDVPNDNNKIHWSD